jgi:hypothetical protein
MAGEPGAYWFANDAHAMAVNTLAPKPLWQDIAQGRFEYDALDEMKDAIKAHPDS